MMGPVEFTNCLLHTPERFDKYVPKSEKNRYKVNKMLCWLFYAMNWINNHILSTKKVDRSKRMPVKRMIIQFPSADMFQT